MGKGRNFAPSTQREGVWFKDVRDFSVDASRTEATTTGRFLSAPFTVAGSRRPGDAPPPFELKFGKETFLFSSHDNQHTLRNTAEYFDAGLGKRKHDFQRISHRSDATFLAHSPYGDRPAVATTYHHAFTAVPTEPTIYRRFPHSHPHSSTGLVSRQTMALTYPPEDAHHTALSVLAASQDPRLPPNQWKYSFHKLPPIYPQ